MVIVGIVVFAGASGMCGLTPKGSLAEAWLVSFRVLQGAGGALMYPAALAIVVEHYPRQERGKALALFFGIAGGLTAVGPALGGFLVQWTWRSIFWINIPVAIVALILTARANPETVRRPAPMDYRGLALIASGVGLSVFGFQQSEQWGWSNPMTEITIVAGAVLIAVFLRVERRTRSPLINVRFFADHRFLMDNIILLVTTTVFVPIFFFASEYSQVALGEKATKASLTLLYFFLGFVVAAQVGGRMLDRIGAKRPIVIGCSLACVSLCLWANHATTLRIGPQVWWIVLTGAGMGLMLGQANTDALNRSSSDSYGEATGITQTIRNYGSSMGLAVFGTVLVSAFRSRLTSSIESQGASSATAHHTASTISTLSGSSGGTVSTIPHFVRLDFATAIQHVLYGMGAIMGVAAVIAFLGLQRGVQHGQAAVSREEPEHPSQVRV
jgi:MFS family permease